MDEKLTTKASNSDLETKSSGLSSAKATLESGFKCLCIAARFFNIPTDFSQLNREFFTERPELVDVNVTRAAKFIGLKSKLLSIKSSPKDSKYFPLIAKHQNGHFYLILNSKKVDDKTEFLVFDPMLEKPYSIDAEECQKDWTGTVILLTKRSSVLDPKTKFGLSWFIPAIKKYKRYLSDVLIAAFFVQLLGLATPIFFQVVIDKVLVHRGLTTLDVLAVGFFFVITFEVLLTGLKTYLFAHTTNRIDVELGSTLYKHLLGLPLNYFANTRVGLTVARVKELEVIREFITGTSLTLVLDVLFSIVFVALMFFYAPNLTWIILGAIPFYIILSVVITPIMKRRLEEKFLKSADNHAFLVESVTGAETVKTLSVEPQFRNQWDEKLADYVATSFKSNNISNIYSQCASYINKVTSLLTLYFGALAVVDGFMTVGQFIAFNMLSQRVSGPILRLVNLWQEFQQANISLKRLGDILNLPTEPGYNPNQRSLGTLVGNVRFEDVTFRYNQNSGPVLQNLSFSVSAGEFVGIVGPSGSGKSTLTKLLQRLYHPENGKVIVDDVDLGLVDPAWIRQRVGVVLQDSFLFNRSIRENIAMSDPAVSIDEVIRCSKLSGAHEFISLLSQGYDTLVGEQGSTLSGGQKQRIAIARALISNPQILIFDEATSALDYESESIIQKNMSEIIKGRTVFVIAHRLTSVVQADRILVIDGGKLVECGSHEDLIAKRGSYFNLNSHQILPNSRTSDFSSENRVTFKRKA